MVGEKILKTLSEMKREREIGRDPRRAELLISLRVPPLKLERHTCDFDLMPASS